MRERSIHAFGCVGFFQLRLFQLLRLVGCFRFASVELFPLEIGLAGLITLMEVAGATLLGRSFAAVALASAS